MAKDIFIEYVDPKVLRCILSNWETVSRMDSKKREDIETEYLKRVLTIIDQVNVGGFFPVVYYQTKCYRLYAVEGVSLQTCWRYIRQALSYKLYKDIDMVNAHPTILLGIAEDNGIRARYLKQYVENREKLLAEVQECNPELSRDQVKTNILAVLNGGQEKYCRQFEDRKYIDGFARDAKRMREFTGSGETFTQRKKLMSYAMTKVENELLSKCIEEAKAMDIRVMVLIFDGFQIPAEVNTDELLERLNKISGRVTFKDKSFDECDDIVKFLRGHGIKFKTGIPEEVPSKLSLRTAVRRFLPTSAIS